MNIQKHVSKVRLAVGLNIVLLIYLVYIAVVTSNPPKLIDNDYSYSHIIITPDNSTTLTNNDITFANIPSTFSTGEAGLGPATEQEWTEISQQLIVGHFNKIVLYWRGDGGSVEMAQQFIDALNIAKTHGARIIYHIIGPTVSMHAMVVCDTADEIIVDNSGLFWFHYPFKDIGQDPWNRERIIKSYDSNPAEAYIRDYQWNQCKGKGLLSDEELQQISTEHTTVYMFPTGNGYLKHVMKHDDWEE